MKIVRYNKTSDLTIEFLDQYHYQTSTTYGNFKKGTVKNPYDRTADGVGYIGVGEYKAVVNNRNTNEYLAWKNLMMRCYNEKIRHKFRTYQNCVVCDEWHDYQKFAAWYDENYYQTGTERMCLDKDIMYKNNYLYSPDTCLIVPQRINMMFMNKTNKNNTPNGISIANNGKIVASYNTNYLGTYDGIEQAIIPYNKAKQNHIREVADEYIDIIPKKLYKALYNWIPDSTVRYKNRNKINL